MEILTNYKQISDKIKDIFDIDVSNVPVLDSLSKQEITELLTGCKVNCDTRIVSNLAELIFQLNEYVPALCNLIKMFLHVKHYTGVITFMEKLFVAHVGATIFNSKNKEYSHRERFFDRFIEVVKNTDLELCDYLPFLFAIVEDNDTSVLSAWLAPCLEYLQNVFRENMDEVKAYVDNAPRHKNTYYTLGLEFNTQKTIGEIFNSGETANDMIFAKMLKHYYTETMAFFDKNLENAGNKKFHYVKILASIENPEVTARLENLYDEEYDLEIKAFIKSKLGIADRTDLGASPKHFQVMAQKKVDFPQERTLGVPFEKMPLTFSDGQIANNIDKTYLINIFKNEKDLLNLYGLSDVKTLFDKQDLYNFANSLYIALQKLKDIKEAKWAIRFVSLVSSGELEQDIYNLIVALYELGRVKEGKYFLECMIYSKKENSVNVISRLVSQGSLKFIEHKEYFVGLYAEVMSKSMSDVQDSLVEDEISDESLSAQKDRLYQNFIAGKSYSKEQFTETFINKKVFNKLAQRLVFGEYKQNRLVSLFVLEGDQIKYIFGTRQDGETDISIKIAHSLDLDDRCIELRSYFAEPTFNQFDLPTFAVKDSEKTLTKVSNMQGILINALNFTSNLQNQGFIRNIVHESDDTTELVHLCQKLNLLAEVSFEAPLSSRATTASLEYIRFYKLNQCLKNGPAYIINKANALAIGSIEPRYYNYVLSAVSKALKN